MPVEKFADTDNGAKGLNNSSVSFVEGGDEKMARIGKREKERFFDKLDYCLFFVIGICIILRYFLFLFRFEILFMILDIVLRMSIVYLVVKFIFNFIKRLKLKK